MAAVNPIEHLKQAVTMSKTFIIKDVKALTDQQATTSPGGVARTPINFIAECAGVNGNIATFLSTGEVVSHTQEERDRLLASFDTTEKALASLESETDKLLAAYDTLDVETLGDPSSFYGMPMTRFQIAALPATHMMYHDGQLNYLQALNGDGEMHWF